MANSCRKLTHTYTDRHAASDLLVAADDKTNVHAHMFCFQLQLEPLVVSLNESIRWWSPRLISRVNVNKEPTLHSFIPIWEPFIARALLFKTCAFLFLSLPAAPLLLIFSSNQAVSRKPRDRGFFFFRRGDIQTLHQSIYTTFYSIVVWKYSLRPGSKGI